MALSDIVEPFVWGQGGSRLTPEQIARQRQIAGALMQQGLDFSPIASPWQGLARVANAAAGAYKNYRADNADNANASTNESLIANLLSGSGPQQFPEAPGTGDSGVPASADAGNPNVGSTIDFAHATPANGTDASPLAFAGVSQAGKGWTTVQTADGQTIRRTGSRNWRNNNPGNIEYGPFAKSAGAIGTDGRFAVFPTLEAGRAAKEKLLFDSPNYRDKTLAQAINRWAPPSENNTASYYGQLARAAGVDPNVRMADLTPQQRQAVLARMEVVEGFRPGREEVMGGPAAAAVTAFAGGQPVPPAPTQVASLDQSVGLPQQAPVPQAAPPLPAPRTIQDMPIAGTPAGQQVAQALAGPDLSRIPVTAGGNAGVYQPGQGNMAAIVQALSSPYADDQTKKIAGLLLGNTMQQQQEQQAAQAAMAQREAAARAAGINPMFASDPELWKQAAAAQFRDPATATVGNVVVDTRTGHPIYTGQAEQPTSVQEYEFYRQQAGQNALPYDQWDQARRRSGATSVNTGTIPQGYQLTTDPVTGAQRLEVIPGGPADTTKKDAATADSKNTFTDVVTNAADLARKAYEGATLPTTGLTGKVLGEHFPSTGAAEVRRQVRVLSSNATIENLNAMRQQSPTGGALGNVTEGEGKMLAAKAGALDPDSPTFIRDLDDYERTLLRIVHGKDAGDKIFEETRKTTGGDGWIDKGNGIRVRKVQ